jgi:hypothetical protein
MTFYYFLKWSAEKKARWFKAPLTVPVSGHASHVVKASVATRGKI